jgi:hypothetical protein
MLVQMTQQTIPFARQYRRKAFPTLKGKCTFPDLFAALGAMPRVDECSSVILDAAAHQKPYIGRASAVRRDRRPRGSRQ